ncbi:MAG: MATE family efflux transporter [Eubacteriaceae bacterium]|nr:MATE family efflux transporter [Eubacteriaceae bacterium]
MAGLRTKKSSDSVTKMGTAPMGALMFQMGIPMILSMMVQALYNIVDTYFVSGIPGEHMGDIAVNALTLSYPIQMLLIAVGVGTGVGINAIISRTLGEGNREKASKIAGNAIFVAFIIYLVFLAFGIFGTVPYVSSQTQNMEVSKMAISYLRICMIFSFGASMFVSYEKLLQATGKTTLSMIAQIAGAMTNIILDPVFIFGMFGLPAMGIEGAALATVIGQVVSFILDAVFHYIYNRDVMDTSFSYIKPEWRYIKAIYQVGLPAIVMQALMSFMTYGVNIIFGAVAENAVTAYGVYYKLQQFVMFAAFGLNNAMIPIIGYNYGAGDADRVKQGVRWGLIYTIGIMAIGMVAFQIFAEQLSGIFALSSEVQGLCITAIRIVTIGYVFIGANIAYQGIFQAFGHGYYSLWVSLVRMILVALPVAWGLSLLPGAENIIWWAFPIAEICGFLLSLTLMRVVTLQDIKPMEEKAKANISIKDPALNS